MLSHWRTNYFALNVPVYAYLYGNSESDSSQLGQFFQNSHSFYLEYRYLCKNLEGTTINKTFKLKKRPQFRTADRRLYTAIS